MSRRGEGTMGPYAGEQNGRATMTDDDVYMARLGYVIGRQTISHLALIHNVPYSTMYAAVKGHSWKDVEMPSPTNGVVCVPTRDSSDDCG